MTDLAKECSSAPTAALLTPRGRGAVATVCLAGDCRVIDVPAPPLFRAANRRPVHEQPIDRIVFGRWGPGAGEEVVLCRTGEQTAEIHCHGGDTAARAILADLESRGCAVVGWSQQLELSAGRFEAECLEALSRATTSRTAELLLEQQSGVLRREIEAIRQLAGGGQASMRAIRDRLDALLKWADFGLHLSMPWNVVLAGRPNVGKSSLINALVGFSRSIVFDQPGTTRDVVTAETALEGWPVRLSDTAGLRGEGDELETAGMARARLSLAEADCRVLLFDVSRPLNDDDRRLLAEWPDAVRVAHKCDLPAVWPPAELEGALPVSSLTGAGLDELAALLVARLAPAVPTPGTPVPVAVRQVELLSRARRAIDAAGVASALEECLE